MSYIFITARVSITTLEGKYFDHKCVKRPHKWGDLGQFTTSGGTEVRVPPRGGTNVRVLFRGGLRSGYPPLAGFLPRSEYPPWGGTNVPGTFCTRGVPMSGYLSWVPRSGYTPEGGGGTMVFCILTCIL